MRGRGIGCQLLLASLADLRRLGYERAVIPWTDALDVLSQVQWRGTRTPLHCVCEVSAIDSAPVKKDAKSRCGRENAASTSFRWPSAGAAAWCSAALAFWFFKKQAENVVEGDADRYDEAIMDAVHRIDNLPMHRTSCTSSRSSARTSPSAPPPGSPR